MARGSRGVVRPKGLGDMCLCVCVGNADPFVVVDKLGCTSVGACIWVEVGRR
jgi:hypothetical protein